MATQKLTLEERLWSQVDKSGDCWLWTGPLSLGYGVLNINGRHLRAHRLVYEAVKGAIPTGMLVCHSCDNPPCVNPAHLWLGTIKDNNRDSRNKGRHFQARKTHCKRGHALIDGNLVKGHGVGWRKCLICKRASKQASKKRCRLARQAKEVAHV